MSILNTINHVIELATPIVDMYILLFWIAVPVFFVVTFVDMVRNWSDEVDPIVADWRQTVADFRRWTGRAKK